MLTTEFLQRVIEIFKRSPSSFFSPQHGGDELFSLNTSDQPCYS